MKIERKHIFIVFFMIGNLFIISTDCLFAQECAYPFLRFGVGAKALGIGSAYVSLADDASCVFWNPASIGMKEKREVTFMHTAFQAGKFSGRSIFAASYHFIGYVHPNLLERRIGGIGFGLIRYSIGGIKITEKGPYGNYQPTQGVCKDTCSAFILSYGKELFANLLSVGGSIKLLHEKLYTSSAYGFGLDLSALANVSDIFNRQHLPLLWIFYDVRMGLTLQINFDEKWEKGDSDAGNINAYLGLSFNTIKSSHIEFSQYISLNQEKTKPLCASFGSELSMKFIPLIDCFSLRCGINSLYIESRKSNIDLQRLNYAKKFTFGVGVKVKFLKIDMATVFGRLGIKHYLSTSFVF